ncbi:MAG: hypothetical protein OXF54_21135 [Caldilineaceae bacterium]|nr:hypothetical protein [Caldilineaceae bacterium]
MEFLLFWSALWILGTGLFLYLTMMFVRWMTVRFSQGVEANVRAAESIVNDERVPEAWTAPYRQQIETLRRSVGSEAEIERAGRRGHKDCLRQLDRLVQYFEKSNLVDSTESRHVLLTGLQRQRERWVAGGWQYVLERDYDH